MSTTWELVKIQTLRPQLDLMKHKVHFNKVPSRLMCKLQFERHWSGQTIHAVLESPTIPTRSC